MAEQIAQLSDFDAGVRRAALEQLFDASAGFHPPSDLVNMHMHSFFSFNGEGWSPSRLVWEAKEQRLYSAAVVDFDVLEGLVEFLDAGDLLQLRCAGGFETRTFFSEYADHEINSPGEPGVFYFMGMGFVKPPAAGSSAAATLQSLNDRAQSRNRDLVARINTKVGDFAVEYDSDVAPLAPAGNITERHIVQAYYRKGLQVCAEDRRQAAAQWADILDTPADKLLTLVGDGNAFSNILRSKMMKKGGLGYVQPTAETFPRLDDVIAMILECEAIPMSAWLDGTRSGEADPGAQLECLVAKGVQAVNIIPDRNWNYSDPDEKARKVAELDRYVAAAQALDLPINVGTELNKPGQRFVDDFQAEPMQPHHAAFLQGAQVMVGQTVLLRYAGMSYVGEAAAAEFPGRKERNAFFSMVGALPVPPLHTRRELAARTGERAYAFIQDSVRAGSWLR